MNELYWLFLILLLLLLVLLPRVGLFAQVSKWRASLEREQVEDSLKHLLQRQREGRFASLESLSGAMGIPANRIVRLVQKMETQGLLVTRGSQLQLTSEGERWAIHIVRAHRLWERYLVDEARMPLNQIHRVAHRREHTLSEKQLDDLDASLGYPARDPHGDFIPSRSGALPAADGVPLTRWEYRRPAQIVHLEDEPAIAFEQILAAGLHLGQTIHIVERTPHSLILSDGENEYRLAPAVASNISVSALPESSLPPEDAMRLSELPFAQPAQILRLDDAVQGFTRRRFLDLGLTPGALVFPELRNFFADPRAYRVRGTLIALRKDQAAQIWIKPVDNTEL
ncbi:MAG: iron dependent repressor, metal binding and dimerization domain protein [Chloroflexota bacterium]|jgi:DtxR family Mn-dependent transcriptional regulator